MQSYRFGDGEYTVCGIIDRAETEAMLLVVVVVGKAKAQTKGGVRVAVLVFKSNGCGLKE
jgi:hypothetical protein